MLALFAPLLAIIALWSLAWKGWALWTAAQNKSKWWFIILLILNTAGILDIIYIFLVAKKKLHISFGDHHGHEGHHHHNHE